MGHRHRTWPERPARSASWGGGRGVRALVIVSLICGATGLVAWLDSPGFQGVEKPPEPRRLDAMRAGQLTSHAIDNGVFGGALAAEQHLAAGATPEPMESSATTGRVAAKAPPAPPTPPAPPAPRTGPRPAISLRVKSELPQATPEAATHEALVSAQRELTLKLAELTPPIHATPTLAFVRAAVVPNSARVINPTPEVRDEMIKANVEEHVWVELEVEVSPAQLRTLRSQDRGRIGIVLGGTGAVVLLAFLSYLRADNWTRGHLSWVLRLVLTGGAIGAVVGLTRLL